MHAAGKRWILAAIGTAVLLGAASLLAQSEEKQRIAVLDFAPSNVPEGIAASVTDMLSTELVNTSVFEVIERMQVKKILNEQGLQKTGVTESETAAEVGRILNLKQVIIGNVGKLGQSLVVTMKLVSVEKANIIIAEKEVAKNEDDLVRACEVLVQKLVRALQGPKEVKGKPSPLEMPQQKAQGQPASTKPVESQAPAPAPAAALGGIPEAAVVPPAEAPAKETKEEKKPAAASAPARPLSPLAIGGWSSLGAGALVAVLGGVGHWQMVEAKSDYERSGSAAAKDDFTLWKSVAIAGYAVGGAGVAAGVTLLVLDALSPHTGKEQKSHQVAVTPLPGGISVSASWRW